MSEYDWSKFTKRISVKAPIETIYEAWTTQDGLEDWFLRLAQFTTPDGNIRERDDFVQKDDRYKWLWHGWPDETVEFGLILETNGKDLVQFSFAATCTVTVSIKKEQGETIVELSQEHIPLDESSKVKYHLGCMEGWTFYLANLKSIMEGGVDLRNKNVKLAQLVNA
jgi:uncharacterized protein YndB with AHSA1/START domain